MKLKGFQILKYHITKQIQRIAYAPADLRRCRRTLRAGDNALRISSAGRSALRASQPADSVRLSLRQTAFASSLAPDPQRVGLV